MAAGYDTRAYRFAPPGGSVSFFEVDLPEASSRKRQLAGKLSMVPSGVEPPVYVPADLSEMVSRSASSALIGMSWPPDQLDK